MTDISLPSEQRLVRTLARASGRFRLRFTERWLFGIGGALVVAGVVAVIIGYVGTSQTILVSGQIPYVVSGGLLGVALVFVGGFLYFGHWMAMLVREGRERGAEDRNDLARLRDSIGELNDNVAQLVGVLAGSAARAGGGGGTRRAGGGGLVATASGTMMHRPDCAAVAGKSGLRKVSAADGLKPCGICQPLGED